MTCGAFATRFGLRKPVILGSSFGGDAHYLRGDVLPDHPGGIVLG